MTPRPGIRVSSESSRTKDYGYSNARIRGMRSRLLARETLDAYLRTDDLKSVLQQLMHSEYAEDLEEVLIRGRGAHEVDEGLRHNLVRTYRKVLGFLNDEAYDICSTLLGRWDVFNLKTILRGKHLRLRTAEIEEALLPVGALTELELAGLLAASDLRDVVNLAATWGLPEAAALRQGLVDHLKTGTLSSLELPLDRHFAARAATKLSKNSPNYAMARWVLGAEIDNLNLITVFRAARENLEAGLSASYFLPGGLEIDLEKYERLASLSDTDEILDELRGTHYGTTLDDAAVLHLESASLSVFERALEDYLTRKVLALGTTDPLGVGIPIAYLWAKQNEVTNLRIIVKCKSVGLPMDRTRRELIVV